MKVFEKNLKCLLYHYYFFYCLFFMHLLKIIYYRFCNIVYTCSLVGTILNYGFFFHWIN